MKTITSSIYDQKKTKTQFQDQSLQQFWSRSYLSYFKYCQKMFFLAVLRIGISRLFKRDLLVAEDPQITECFFFCTVHFGKHVLWTKINLLRMPRPNPIQHFLLRTNTLPSSNQCDLLSSAFSHDLLKIWRIFFWKDHDPLWNCLTRRPKIAVQRHFK